MRSKDGWDFIDSMVAVVREPLLVLDGDLRVKQASDAFYREFKLTPEHAQGRLIYELADGWNAAAIRRLLQEILPAEGAARDYPVNLEVPGTGRRAMTINARHVRDGASDSKKPSAILLTFEDVVGRQAAEIEAARHRQWLATALSSIGDAVITTDYDARVTFMNPTAERLTGWKLGEAQGRPLHEVFHIVNEDTRNLVESPVAKAIRMGNVVGLANHTVLIAKDGTERPIDDSAAPIRDEAGNILGVVMVFHDITDRRTAERVQARLAEIVNSSEDAIVAKDLNGTITAWNRGAERLFGYTAEEAIGKSITIVIPPDRLDEETQVLERIGRGDRIDNFETVRRRRDGSTVEISLTVSPIRNRHGEVIGASKIARDITDRRRFEAEIEAHLMNEQALRMEAEAANRSKDLFLATLSHELRTPLNAIVGWVNILRADGRNEKDLHEGLEVIDRNAKAQVRLIEDVLDVSRIVSGTLRLNVTRCELAAVIESAVDAVLPAADAKRIRIEIRVDPLASPGTCDQARLQQVVWNLLSNAIKFTPEGGSVTVELAREGSMARLSVSDTGQGISPTFLPHVFDRFRQADSTTRRRFGGLGLGLSIVKQLVEMHGGTVRAQSAGEGHGATFIVLLPVAALQGAPSDEAGVASNAAYLRGDDAGELNGGATSVSLEGLRIVVVDDEPDARRVLSKLLTDAGALVTVAASAKDARQAIEKVRPHLLISDIAMPDEDGYDLIGQVHAAGHTAQTLPAIALTAFAHKADARKAQLAGYQVHLSKPVDPRDLLAAAASLTGRTG